MDKGGEWRQITDLQSSGIDDSDDCDSAHRQEVEAVTNDGNPAFPQEQLQALLEVLSKRCRTVACSHFEDASRVPHIDVHIFTIASQTARVALA
jgi:hypothetical protein